MAFPWSIPQASPWAWEAQARRNSLALPLFLFFFFYFRHVGGGRKGLEEEGGREGAEFSMSSCQNVISCVARAGSLGRIN